MAKKPVLLEDKILFKFELDVVNGGFSRQSDSGIQVREFRHEQVKVPRWGTVIDVGPECVEVKPGNRILIEQTMWTTGIDLEDNIDEEYGKFWVTRERDVMAIDES